MKIKKIISAILSAALIALAPGMAPYQVLAATLGVEASVKGTVAQGGAVRLAGPNIAIAPTAAPMGAAGVMLAPSALAPAVVEAAAPAEAESTLEAVSARHAEIAKTLENKDLSSEDSSHAAAALIERAPQRGASDGSVSAAPKSLAGKTLLLIGSKKGRDYLINEPVAQSKKYGFDLIVLDYPEQKDYAVAHGVKPENFIAADIGNHSPENIRAIAKQIQTLRETRPIHAVKTFLNAYALLEGHLGDALTLPTHPAQAVAAAHTKNVARELMNADPELALPSRIVADEKDAAAAFAEMKGRGIDKVVMKPASGGGGLFVVIDIDSPEKAGKVYAQIDKGISDLLAADAHKAQSKHMDQKPSILMEAQIPEGIMLDVEMLMQDGEVVWTSVSYNMPPNEGNQEKGTTYPSLLTQEQLQNVNHVTAKGVKALGLRTGNVHTEAIYTNQGTKIIEVNARMGGADVWENILESSGVNLIEQGILAAFDAPIMPQSKLAPTLLQHRFIIPKVSGKIVSIEGLSELASEGDVYHVEVLKKAGDTVAALPEDSSDYLGYVTVRGRSEGKTLDRLIDLLDRVKIRIQTADGTIVEQTAAYAHDKVLVSDLQHLVAPQQPASTSWKDFWAKLKAGLKQIPKPFHHFVWGSSLLTMASEGISIITSIYGISTFGPVAGVLSQAVSLVFRIPGSLIGAKLVKKFDAKKMYIFTTALQGLLLLSLPLGSFLWGTAAISVFGLFSVNAFLMQYMVFQAMSGLIYGATRGMAESQIMPRLVGQDPKLLETAGFLWMAAVETFALTTAFFLSPWVRGTWGPNAAIGVFGAIMLSSIFFFRKIQFLDEPKIAAAPEKKAEAPKNDEGKLDKLPLREYIPYVTSSFLHFVFYSLFGGVFATYTFEMDKMADWATGFYDSGSLAIGLLAAIPALIATLDPKTTIGAQAPGEKKKGFIAWFNSIPLKYWFAMAVGGGILYLGTGLAGIKIAGLAAAAALGALTTVNRTKWMASYLSRLKSEHHGRVIARLNSASVAATLVPFVIFSVGQLMGVAIMPLLTAISAVIAVGMAAAWLMKRN